MQLFRRVISRTIGLWSFRKVAASSMDSTAGIILTEELEQHLAPYVSGLGETWAQLDQRQKLVRLSEISRVLWTLLGLPLDSLPQLQVGTSLLHDNHLTEVDRVIEGDFPDGWFDPTNNRIHINENMMVIFVDALETLAHELRHGFQKYHINKLERNLSCHPQASVWRDEFRRPVNPLQNYVEYSNQCVEVDSNQFTHQVCRAVDRIGGG